MLLGIEGMRVTATERGADGRLEVHAEVTAPAACQQCGTFSGKVQLGGGDPSPRCAGIRPGYRAVPGQAGG